MPTMTISDDDWTHDGMVAVWADSDDTAPYAGDCADTEEAWLTNNTHEYLPGWSFADGTFSGPASEGALGVVLQLTTTAVDYVLSVLDEIAAEYETA